MTMVIVCQKSNKTWTFNRFMQPYNFNCNIMGWKHVKLTQSITPNNNFPYVLAKVFNLEMIWKFIGIWIIKSQSTWKKPNTKRVLDLDIIILYFHCILSITTNVPTNYLTQHTTLVQSNSNVLNKWKNSTI